MVTLLSTISRMHLLGNTWRVSGDGVRVCVVKYAGLLDILHGFLSTNTHSITGHAYLTGNTYVK